MGCAARSALTFAAPIRATLSASAPSAPGVTACCGAACPTARLCRTAWLEDDDEERGLIFVCLNASIARQFELVQGHWLNDGDSFGLGADRDFLLGAADSEGKMTVPGRTPRFLSPQQEFVRLRGGEYLFVPGMNALRSLAAGA